MTGRGRAGNPVPLLPPRDPTLGTRPVPQERHFHVRSFGPGAAPEINRTVRSVEDLDRQLDYPDTERCDETGRAWEPSPYNGSRDFLRRVEKYSNLNLRNEKDFVPDPTWGFHIVVTAYSKKAQDNLHMAVLKVVETIRRSFLQNITPEYKRYDDEAFKRLRLDVIQDKDLLEDASDDRVREEFNAFVRSQHLWDEEDELEDGWPERYMMQKEEFEKDGYGYFRSRPPGPPRLLLCIVFDKTTIEELSGLMFPDDAVELGHAVYDMSLKAVARHWEYPREPNCETKYYEGGASRFFTGVDQCPLDDIPGIYESLRWSGFLLQDIFPMSRNRALYR
ncbi:hypothetical protein QQX98_008736 [Neonectria punicea]|uniref:Uncharacterized protein n=1 Tax=Neonectria punicea TaxID=979145 RepID=A0ABR1GUL0_9HYPO